MMLRRFRKQVRPATLLLSLLAAFPAIAQPNPPPFHIYGIAGIRVYISNMAAARTFYKTVTNAENRNCDLCETGEPAAIRFASGQFLLFSQQPKGATLWNRIAEVSFEADNLKSLRQLFKARKIKYQAEEQDGEIVLLRAFDPEGHSLVFLNRDIPVRLKAFRADAATGSPLRETILHAGYIVKDPDAMNKFYRDLLGFRVYWHGGMEDTKTDWVDMQVPDGTQWIEYMLGVPPDSGPQARGVMNHVALGVIDVRAADKALADLNVKLNVDEQPQIGRDGKWQLNLYDSDGTRVELMEFTPVAKPCCSEYTGPHPQP